MAAKRIRHVLGLSGGKDSAALAVYMREKYPDIPTEYFFCDTGSELPETYEFLDRLKARLGIQITYLCAERGFDHWLKVFKGFLPSATARWCTLQLKIIPIEKFIGDDDALSYIAIRADEDREGYISSKDNINPVFPFKDDGIVKKDVYRILEESGIGLPKYYEWRSRSGCYFCFFQRNIEWIGLYDNHPDLFERAAKYESEHPDGRKYTWNDGESLWELISRRDEIIEEYRRSEDRLNNKVFLKSRRTLAETLDELDEVEGFNPCAVCHI